MSEAKEAAISPTDHCLYDLDQTGGTHLRLQTPHKEQYYMTKS